MTKRPGDNLAQTLSCSETLSCHAVQLSWWQCSGNMVSAALDTCLRSTCSSRGNKSPSPYPYSFTRALRIVVCWSDGINQQVLLVQSSQQKKGPKATQVRLVRVSIYSWMMKHLNRKEFLQPSRARRNLQIQAKGTHMPMALAPQSLTIIDIDFQAGFLTLLRGCRLQR